MLGLGIMTRWRQTQQRIGDGAFLARSAVARCAPRAFAGDAGGKRIVVHVGPRKTGTSTIQRMLEDNRASLCPLFLRDDGGPLSDLREAGIAYSKAPGPRTRIRLRRAASCFDAVLRSSPGDVAIVSDENLAGFAIMQDDRDLFAIMTDVLSILETELHRHDLTFVVYTRERDGWLRSCHNQDVKKHKCLLDFPEWFAVNGACRDFADGCEALARGLRSKILVVAMEDELGCCGPLGRRVLDAAGYSAHDIAALSVPPRQNESLGPRQLAFMREINALDLPFSVTGRIAETVSRRRDLFTAEDGGAVSSASRRQTAAG